MNKYPLNALEKRAISALACVFGLRMLGLFMILPVLSIYAEQLQGSTPMLMGIALGIYGITQAVLQIPFGMLSDRYGRKPIIIIGLLIFAFGGLVAGMAETITGVIIGRALQGGGAIAAVILALTSDLTREEQRTKAMAIIGMSIGLSFLIALIIAPLLSSVIGVSGLFVLTSILALSAILLVWKVIPTPSQTIDLNVSAVPSRMLELLRDPQLIRLDVGIFILHFVLTAIFVVVPVILLEQNQLTTEHHWKVYVPALLASVVCLIPLVILSSRKQWLMRVFLFAICLILFAQCLFMWRPLGILGITVCLFVFFWGFNLLEAMLPSLVSRVAPVASKGSAMGVYNTFQFLGVFCGGVLGGLVYGQVGYNGVFALCGTLLIIWGVLILTAPKLQLLDSRLVKLPSPSNQWRETLIGIEGVEDAVIVAEAQTAYLKVDKRKLDEQGLRSLLSDAQVTQ